MQRRYFILLALFIALSLSCQEELNIEPPVDLSPRILNVEPNPAKYGDVIAITVKNFAGPYKDCNWWIDHYFAICIDSVRGSKLYTKAPWNFSGGVLFYKTSTDTIKGPSLIFAPRPPQILNVEPKSVQPGDFITITVDTFAQHYSDWFWWIGSQNVPAQYTTSTKLVTRAPWGNGGVLSYKLGPDTVAGPSIFISLPCSSNVCVSPYKGPTITKSSTRDIPGLQRIKIVNDTISMFLWYQPYPDGAGSVITTLRFKHFGNSILPLFLNVTGYYTQPQSIRGYIAIDRWSIPGVLSGHVLFYVTDWWDEYNFYCEVK